MQGFNQEDAFNGVNPKRAAKKMIAAAFDKRGTNVYQEATPAKKVQVLSPTKFSSRLSDKFSPTKINQTPLSDFYDVAACRGENYGERLMSP